MLRQIRNNKGITQEKLATLVGVSVQSISNYENGQRTPDYDIRKKIIDSLKIRGKQKDELDDYFAEVTRKRKEE